MSLPSNLFIILRAYHIFSLGWGNSVAGCDFITQNTDSECERARNESNAADCLNRLVGDFRSRSQVQLCVRIVALPVSIRGRRTFSETRGYIVTVELRRQLEQRRQPSRRRTPRCGDDEDGVGRRK